MVASWLARPVPTASGCSRKTLLKARFMSGNSTKAYIALGSNLGDRIKNIEKACKLIERLGMRVTRTSHLYETKPMYYEHQANFLNGVCEIDVGNARSPIDLLKDLKSIEESMGRTKTIDKGPRNIDLDIVLHGEHIWKSDDLVIPHIGMLDREFVLSPLCDLIPHETHPDTGTRYIEHLMSLDRDRSMSTVTALGKDTLKALDNTRRTRIMAILNLTPDSFSDGGKHSTGLAEVMKTVENFVHSGADIIDVGGCSTRPRAPEVSIEEEMERVVPAIRAIRQQYQDLNISIDTFHHEVAREAVKNGADFVNDISAGRLDPKMLPTIAELDCSYIAMHSRGDPRTMSGLTKYRSGDLNGIGEELAKALELAEDAGIRKWRITLDPGIGFAKTTTQNLNILRRFDDLRRKPGLTGFPWLVGASRKGFIGSITGVRTASERVWGTAATVTASIQGGADIVRVHDVAEMAQVVKMADAIWRVK